MLEVFERTLADGGDLETAREHLITQANQERINAVSRIDHDYRIAVLLREALLTEPKGSGGYGVAKAVLNRLKKKYHDPEREKFLKKLRKELNQEQKARPKQKQEPEQEQEQETRPEQEQTQEPEQEVLKTDE